MITEQEALCYIRMTLKQWKLPGLRVCFKDKLAVKWAMGLFWWGVNAEGDVIAIELRKDILSSFALFRHVFLHELAHALDYDERGTLRVNGRRNAHGANFNKWCKRLKIQKGAFVPERLMA